jgi:phosphoglycolate phosphatase
MTIRAAILDVDGTVATCPYDFDAMRAAVREVAARWGLDISSLRMMGVIEQMAYAATLLDEGTPSFRAEAEAAVCAIEVEAAKGAELLPGAPEALGELREHGVALGLITRNCRAAAELVLRGIEGDHVLLTRDDVPAAKPDPDHVLRTLARLGHGPGETVVVGDHDYDMEAGRAAGVRLCVGVRTGSRSDQHLCDAGADAMVDSLAHLPRWLRCRGELGP